VVAIFVGSYVQKLDAKGRVSVPAPFRDVLGKDATFYAYPALENDSVDCRTANYMARISDQVDELELMSDEQSRLGEVLLGMSHALTPDKEGRVVLPDALREHTGVSDQVVFVGLGKMFRIWEPGRHEIFRRQARLHALADRQALRRRPQAGSESDRPVDSGT